MPETGIYEVRDGTIVSPGKFEGEASYMPEAYNLYLDGFANFSGNVVRVILSSGRPVAFIVDDQGFVCEVRRG